MPIEVKTYIDVICPITNRSCAGIYCEEFKTCEHPPLVAIRDRREKRRMGR